MLDAILMAIDIVLLAFKALRADKTNGAGA